MSLSKVFWRHFWKLLVVLPVFLTRPLSCISDRDFVMVLPRLSPSGVRTDPTPKLSGRLAVLNALFELFFSALRVTALGARADLSEPFYDADRGRSKSASSPIGIWRKSGITSVDGSSEVNFTESSVGFRISFTTDCSPVALAKSKNDFLPLHNVP